MSSGNKIVTAAVSRYMGQQIEAYKLTFFTQQLLDWFAQNHRPLPWKNEDDPYLIWLSEIILQQTRVEQGRPYYEKFKNRFPTVHDLAAASEDEVLKLWEGLGYYSRARNLHFTAKFIADELDGVFPSTYKNIKSLKGVGPYTAAAIASFAYNLPHAVVDGNVYRVLARFFGIETPTDTTAGKKEFARLASRLLDQAQPGRYNQALMDFGATQCTPKAPTCGSCPLQSECTAFREGTIQKLPIKSKKLKKRSRYFYYLLFHHQGEVLLQRREEKDIWQGLYEFPLIEQEQFIKKKGSIFLHPTWRAIVGEQDFSVEKISKPFKQTLSHQHIIATFWEIELTNPFPISTEKAFAVPRKKLSDFAFPRIIDWYLQDNSLYLELL